MEQNRFSRMVKEPKPAFAYLVLAAVTLLVGSMLIFMLTFLE